MSLSHIHELTHAHTQTQSVPYQWEGERSPFTSCINYEWQAKGHRGRRGHSYGQNIDLYFYLLSPFCSPACFPYLSLCLTPLLIPHLSFILLFHAFFRSHSFLLSYLVSFLPSLLTLLFFVVYICLLPLSFFKFFLPLFYKWITTAHK